MLPTSVSASITTMPGPTVKRKSFQGEVRGDDVDATGKIEDP
jgi:hypothetical protein